MNKKAILMASFLLVGSFSFAQKLSPSTSMMLHEARTAQKKAKAANATPQTVSAFITVKSQDAIAKIEALGAKVNSRISETLVTADMPLSAIEPVSNLDEVVSVSVGTEAKLLMDNARKLLGVDECHQMTENNGPYTGKGVVIGIVDNGFQYDHVDFLNADKSDTRIKRVWDQHGTGNAPEGFGYGAEYKTTAEIRAAKYDLTSGFHATHVSGIASGSDKSTPYYGVAPDADLVFVSFKSTNAQIVDGIKYVFDYAKSVGKPAVVNISLGSHMGPHDGSSDTDLSFANLVGPGRIIVGAAGNEGLDKLHASKTFTAANKQMKIIQRNFNNHWGKEDPWQDESHHVIPGFIEGIAKRQPVYKYLTNKFPNDPDSVEYYLNKPHKVKLFDYDNGYIEKEVSTMDSIRYMVHFMHCAFVAMEPQTGAVKAWVGDIDFGSWKYDKVTAMRQPGSTFKLFVYTEAMNQGLTPCDKRRDEYISMPVYDKAKQQEVLWTPTNANGSFSGDSIPLKGAFARSINSIAVRLGQEMGIARIIDTAHKMGIVSPLDDNPSLALGSSDINLLELANAYCTVADDGRHHDPTVVTRIVDKDGREVYTSAPNTVQAIPYRSAFLMQQLLMGGMREPGGTSMSFGGFVGKHRDTDWGGKTGTSNNHSDAWFMAVSPKLVVGAWVGGEYRCIHFRTGALGQGSRTALPLCGYFVESVLNDPSFSKYHAKFGKPKDDAITYNMYNCASYVTHAKRDTLDTDSIAIDDEIMLNESGEPIHNNSTTTGGEEKHHNQRTTEEVVDFNNL